MIHQRMAGIEQQFDLFEAVTFFALGNIGASKHQVVDDRIGAGPGLKQVVALKETVVPVARVRDHQRLHRHGVLFHEVGDARVGVDDDFV